MLKQKIKHYLKQLNIIIIIVKNYLILKMIEKKDNKGIKLIKTFIKNMYYLYGKIKGKKDE